MIIIAALSGDGVIGKNGCLPWDIPEELDWFLETIRGETTILGRCSYELFKKDLTSRHTVVVSRMQESIDGVHVVRSLDAAMRLAESLGFEVYCAGGESVFHEAIDLADRMVLSTIKGHYEGDRRFPFVDPGAWELDESEDCPQFTTSCYHRVRD